MLTCDHANNHLNFGSSLNHGILSDGTSFEFFTFDGSTKPATFFRGLISTSPHTSADALFLAPLRGSAEKFIYSLRPICGTIFYFLLRGYHVGLDAYYERPFFEAQNEGWRRESTSAWMSSHSCANDALMLAIDAAKRAANGDISAANEVVKDAMLKLRTSMVAAPPSYKREDCQLMSWWNEEGVDAA